MDKFSGEGGKGKEKYRMRKTKEELISYFSNFILAFIINGDLPLVGYHGMPCSCHGVNLKITSTKENSFYLTIEFEQNKSKCKQYIQTMNLQISCYVTCTGVCMQLYVYTRSKDIMPKFFPHAMYQNF